MIIIHINNEHIIFLFVKSSLVVRNVIIRRRYPYCYKSDSVKIFKLDLVKVTSDNPRVPQTDQRSFLLMRYKRSYNGNRPVRIVRLVPLHMYIITIYNVGRSAHHMSLMATGYYILPSGVWRFVSGLLLSIMRLSIMLLHCRRRRSDGANVGGGGYRLPRSILV